MSGGTPQSRSVLRGDTKARYDRKYILKTQFECVSTTLCSPPTNATASSGSKIEPSCQSLSQLLHY
eukprot:scaffold24009_cov102-Skeletonema_dohrnii-CCMP3373.AAC.3